MKKLHAVLFLSMSVFGLLHAEWTDDEVTQKANEWCRSLLSLARGEEVRKWTFSSRDRFLDSEYRTYRRQAYDLLEEGKLNEKKHERLVCKLRCAHEMAQCIAKGWAKLGQKFLAYAPDKDDSEENSRLLFGEIKMLVVQECSTVDIAEQWEKIKQTQCSGTILKMIDTVKDTDLNRVAIIQVKVQNFHTAYYYLVNFKFPNGEQNDRSWLETITDRKSEEVEKLIYGDEEA